MDGHLSSFPRDGRPGVILPSGRVGISQGRPEIPLGKFQNLLNTILVDYSAVKRATGVKNSTFYREFKRIIIN